MQADKFYHVGKLMAMAIVQGGSGFPFFASSVYAYLCGSPLAAIKVPTGCLRVCTLCVRARAGKILMLSSRCVSFVFGMWWCTSLHTPLPPAHIHNTVQMARIVMLLGGIARVKGFH